MAQFKTVRTFAALTALTIGLIVSGLAYRHTLQHRVHPYAAVNPVVADVNSTLIHKSDLSILSPPTTPQEALGLLVDFTLLDQAARQKNITVSDAELQQQRQQVLDTPGQTYAEAAKALGRTPAGLDLQLRHVVLLRKLADLQFKSRIGPMYHARAILIRPDGKHAQSTAQARQFAVQLQKQIQAGADIAALARTDSDDPASAPSGGDLGLIQLAGAPNLVPSALDFKMQQALAKAVNTATPGSFLHGPIRGDLGYWVVEVVSTSADPRADTARYQQIRQLWQDMWVRRLEPQVMAHLRGSALIEPPVATEPQPPAPTIPGAVEH